MAGCFQAQYHVVDGRGRNPEVALKVCFRGRPAVQGRICVDERQVLTLANGELHFGHRLLPVACYTSRCGVQNDLCRLLRSDRAPPCMSTNRQVAVQNIGCDSPSRLRSCRPHVSQGVARLSDPIPRKKRVFKLALDVRIRISLGPGFCHRVDRRCRYHDPVRLGRTRAAERPRGDPDGGGGVNVVHAT